MYALYTFVHVIFLYNFFLLLSLTTLVSLSSRDDRAVLIEGGLVFGYMGLAWFGWEWLLGQVSLGQGSGRWLMGLTWGLAWGDWWKSLSQPLIERAVY